MSDCAKYHEAISALVDGELSEPEKAGLLEHIEVCRECRFVYDAFAELSGALGGMAAEPPEALLSGAMSAINGEMSVTYGENFVPDGENLASDEKKFAGIKKPRRIYLRYAGLAACLAIVISIAGFVYVTSRGSGSAAPAAGVYGKDSARTGEAAAMEGGAAPESYLMPAAPAGEEAPAPPPQDTVENEAALSETNGARDGIAYSFAMVEDCTADISIYITDEATIEELSAIIEFSCEAAEPSRAPDYSVSISYGGESERAVSVWIGGEAIICQAVGGTVYEAVGSAEALKTLLG